MLDYVEELKAAFDEKCAQLQQAAIVHEEQVRKLAATVNKQQEELIQRAIGLQNLKATIVNQELQAHSKEADSVAKQQIKDM